MKMVQCSQLFLLQLLWGWTVLPQLSLDFLVPRMHAFYIHFSKMPYIKLILTLAIGIAMVDL